MNSYAVRTEALGRRFGDADALRDLDLEVAPGTVLGLLGHNGAGKTTAVRILTTLLAPTSGRALVAGCDVASEPDAVRERIAVAGQEASLDERLTGRENLMLLGRLQRLSKREAVARTGIHLTLDDVEEAARRLHWLEPEIDPRTRRLSVPAPGGPADLRTVLDELDDLEIEEASLSQPTRDDAFFALTAT